jgi:hypothetical protein
MANVVRDPKEHPEANLADFIHPDPLVTFQLKDVMPRRQDARMGVKGATRMDYGVTMANGAARALATLNDNRNTRIPYLMYIPIT